ncbi:MAG: GNAT family N-acetyltransferase [Candidatus Heimdallarchaeota archaeon]|nr:GNAT family N-acetyltransferase [Candidatus Heimdallarchaeota archaeon]MCK5049538.1 GNAT family N-acetyltransferase [Candidatus Heimdallarchaeota archaeon]
MSETRSIIKTKNNKTLKIISKTPSEFTEENWEDYFIIQEQVFKETYPADDPLPSRISTKNQLLNVMDTYDYYTWLIFDDERVIAQVKLVHTNEKSSNYEQSKHIIQTKFEVHKDHRNNGIGTAILKEVILKAKELGKTVLQTYVYLQSSTEFIERKTGAKPAKVGDENRVYFKDVDWDLMKQWVDEGKERAKGVSIEIRKQVPDNLIEEFCECYTETLAQEPSGELEETFVLTPEIQRKYEKQFAENGQIIENAIAIESDGRISGLTEIFYDTNTTHVASQALTGVLEKYRGRGLGKWLKGVLILHMRDNYPEIKFVRAGNAGNNKPMLSINHRMGFKCIFNRVDYNMQIDEISKHLGI